LLKKRRGDWGKGEGGEGEGDCVRVTFVAGKAEAEAEEGGERNINEYFLNDGGQGNEYQPPESTQEARTKGEEREGSHPAPIASLTKTCDGGATTRQVPPAPPFLLSRKR
jgi:hypothetical protein